MNACINCHRPVTEVRYTGLVTTDDDDRRCYGDELPADEVGQVGHEVPGLS